jgi:hypothetical protein
VSFWVKRKKLFLRWCLITILTVAVTFLTFTLGREQLVSLNAVGKVMVGAIVAIYLTKRHRLLRCALLVSVNQNVLLASGKVEIVKQDAQFISQTLDEDLFTVLRIHAVLASTVVAIQSFRPSIELVQRLSFSAPSAYLHFPVRNFQLL